MRSLIKKLLLTVVGFLLATGIFMGLGASEEFTSEVDAMTFEYDQVAFPTGPQYFIGRSTNGVHAEDNGDVYIVDDEHCLRKIDNAGVETILFGTCGSWSSGNDGFKAAEGLDRLSNGSFVIGDTSNNRVVILSSTGEYISNFAFVGNISDVVVDSNDNIYVADFVGDEVEKFDASGTPLLTWGSTGSGDTQFDQPNALAVDSNDDIYVLNQTYKQVKKFDSSGNFIMKFGTVGSGDGQFQWTLALDIDSSDNIYVTDSTLLRINKFSSAGVYDSHYTLPTAHLPYSVEVDGSGNIYSAVGESKVFKLDSSYTLLKEYGEATSSNLGLNDPRGIFRDVSGKYYVSDMDNHRVQIYDSAFTYLNTLGVTGVASDADGSMANPIGTTVDSLGNIYVIEFGNRRVQKFNSSGDYVLKWGSIGSLDGEFNGPTDILVDTSDNIYVTDSGNDRVQKFDSSGNFISKFGTAGSGDGQFGNLEGIALSPEDLLYISDSQLKRIQVHELDGTFVRIIGDASSLPSGPNGLYIDANGDVLVACKNEQSIKKFSPTGVFLGRIGVNNAYGRSSGGLWTPVDVIESSPGSILVVDSALHRVTEFSPLAQVSSLPEDAYAINSQGGDLSVGSNIGGSGSTAITAGRFGGYAENTVANGFSGLGTAKSWVGDDDAFVYNLPLSFPFYGASYTSIAVGTNGMICLDTNFDCSWYADGAAGEDSYGPYIQPFGMDLQTDNGAPDDIYVLEEAGKVTIYWNAVEYGESESIHFEVELHETGAIQFNYGVFESEPSGGVRVAISKGDGVTYIEPSIDSTMIFNEIDSILFAPSNTGPIVEVITDLSADRDWSGIDMGISSSERKAYLAGFGSLPGAIGTFSLYVEKADSDNSVTICPNATSLVATTVGCAGGIVKTAADPGTSVTSFSGKNYWKVTGLTGTGGISSYIEPVVIVEGEEGAGDVVEEGGNIGGVYALNLVNADEVEEEVGEEDTQETTLELDSEDSSQDDKVESNDEDAEDTQDSSKTWIYIVVPTFIIGIIWVLALLKEKQSSSE